MIGKSKSKPELLGACLLLDKSKISKWQLSALKEALDLIEIKVVLNSKTQFGKRQSSKFPLLFDKSISFKKPSIKKVKYDFSGVRVIEFDYNHENGWNFFQRKLNIF